MYLLVPSHFVLFFNFGPKRLRSSFWFSSYLIDYCLFKELEGIAEIASDWREGREHNTRNWTYRHYTQLNLWSVRTRSCLLVDLWWHLITSDGCLMIFPRNETLPKRRLVFLPSSQTAVIKFIEKLTFKQIFREYWRGSLNFLKQTLNLNNREDNDISLSNRIRRTSHFDVKDWSH